MAFERFVRTFRSSASKVSISSRGQISFNTVSTGKFNLERFDYAVVFYDEATRRIGIHFTSDAAEKGAKIITKRPNGLSIYARAFLRYYDLIPEENETYDVSYAKEEDMYVIQLKSKSEVQK